ncbi:MAG: FAD:protein FMN transferase [Planctomycetes bacterium]|nr:FAD:protein FMN transferase [Planctomycetota bacterium]
MSTSPDRRRSTSHAMHAAHDTHITHDAPGAPGAPGVPAWPTRRAVLAFAAGAFVVGAAGGLFRRRGSLVRRTLPVMGTFADLAVVCDDRVVAERALDAAFAELLAVDAAMSRFRDDSDVGRANADAARRAVAVSPATASVLAEALRVAEASDGAFDPCLGRAVQLWDVTHRRAPPSDALVEAFANRRLYASLELDAAGRRVRFADADASLDLGGIAKGWAVDRAADALRRAGITRAFVNVGGDLVAIGRSEDGDPWTVGVADPLRPGQIVATLEVEDGAVATSGDSEQHFDAGGRRYHHLLDPSTGAPRATSAHSLTVAADTCVLADAAATAFFGRDADASARVLRRLDAHARLVLPASPSPDAPRDRPRG